MVTRAYNPSIGKRRVRWLLGAPWKVSLDEFMSFWLLRAPVVKIKSGQHRGARVKTVLRFAHSIYHVSASTHTGIFSLPLPHPTLRSEGRRKGANGCQVAGMVRVFLSKLSITLIRPAQRGMRSTVVRGKDLF